MSFKLKVRKIDFFIFLFFKSRFLYWQCNIVCMYDKVRQIAVCSTLIASQYLFSDENCTKQVMPETNFKPTAIFCIAFAFLHFLSTAHGYSLTTIIKDAANGKSLSDAMWQVFLCNLIFQ